MRPKDLRLFAVVFGLVVFSFVAASAYLRYRLVAIDGATLDISENAAPSILYLATARGEVQNLQLLIQHNLNEADTGHFPATTEIEASRDRIRADLQHYQELPLFPSERPLWEAANHRLVRLDVALDLVLRLLAEHHVEEARATARGELRQAGDQTVQALMAAVEFNAQKAHDRARRIRQLRVGLNHRSFLLDVLCVLWASAVVAVFLYSSRRAALLREEQHRLAIDRAAELEQFAGRVAHDTLNPLSVVTFALMKAKPTAGQVDNPEQRAAVITRAQASVKRICQILDGLLKFACSGARPEKGARAEVLVVLGELIPELSAQAEEAGIRLQTELPPSCEVACSPGILISLIYNLVGNAIKYSRDGADRYIVVRAFYRRTIVRFEVQDNGPGLPPGLEKGVFNPGVRGPMSSAPGFGLGLATVKKAVESHDGKVGVRSVPGQGCLFWFELPSGPAGASPS